MHRTRAPAPRFGLPVGSRKDGKLHDRTAAARADSRPGRRLELRARPEQVSGSKSWKHLLDFSGNTSPFFGRNALKRFVEPHELPFFSSPPP